MQGIHKRFGATQAVDGVDFEACPGRVSALLGENGAGKSTLMKLLYGLHRPDAGTIELDGRTVKIDSPRQAMRLGIGMVFQQFSLIPALSVRENLALVMPATPHWIGRGARRIPGLDGALHEMLPEVDIDLPVAALSVGQIQLVELAKVLLLQARCVVLDEPSSVLAPPEAQRLWTSVRALAARGLSVVLITHKIRDVQACADEVFVLRGGRLAGRVPAVGLDADAVVDLMVGRRPGPLQPNAPVAASALTRLWIKGLQAGAMGPVDLQLRRGEVVGVAGVSGNGQTALAEALAGVRDLDAGEVILDGETLRARGLPPAPPRGLGYIPEQPLANAVAPALSLSLNLAWRRLSQLPFLPDFAAMARDAAVLLARYDVRPRDPQALAGWLSGGNLQKLVAARELADTPAAVVACYPTMGLDVAATAQIYGVLFGLAQQGSAVLWFSEDLDDLVQHAHRIAVMLDGRIVQVFDAAHCTVAEIGACMAGAAPGAAANRSQRSPSSLSVPA